MPPAVQQTITFRTSLKGDLGDWLEAEGTNCPHTVEAFISIVAELVHYSEEGVPLFPDVYVCDNVARMVQILPGTEVLEVGRGPLLAQTAARAVKECAPLARSGWAMYLERADDGFRYGVFSAGVLPLAIPPDEALFEGADESAFLVTASKLSNDCVEVRGARGFQRCIFFSAARQESPSPRTAIHSLVELVTSDVDAEAREATRRVLLRALVEALQSSHGTLIAVVGHDQKALPAFVTAGTMLPSPVEFETRVRDYVMQQDDIGFARLHGAATLLRGMVGSDGIVTFRTDASVIGYRGFLERPAGGTHGGARRRTFDGLAELVTSRTLRGAFIRSQDGATEFSGGVQ